MNTDSELAVRELLHRWFVLYNPFYFASAALVLLGVARLTTGAPVMGVAGFLLPDLLLLFYRASLLGAVFLLERRGARRPAVLLGLLSVVLWFDPTLQSEHTAAHLADHARLLVALLRAALVPAFALALASILRLRTSRGTLRLLTGTAATISVGSALFELDEADPERVFLGLVASALVVAVVLLRRPIRIESAGGAFGGWSRTVARRAALFLGGICVAGLGLHLAALAWIHEAASPECAAVFALAAVVAVGSERRSWTVLVASVLGVLVLAPEAAGAWLVAAAVAVGARAVDRRSFEPLVSVPVLLWLAAATREIGGASHVEAPWVLTVATSGLLCWMAWRLRLSEGILWIPVLAVWTRWEVALSPFALGLLSFGLGLASLLGGLLRDQAFSRRSNRPAWSGRDP